MTPVGLQSYSLFHPEDSTRRPAALLFHGVSGSIEELHDLARHLHERNFDVYLPMLTGHGTDIRELARVPASRFIADAEDAFNVLKARDPSAIVVIGLSFGSILALYITGTHSREIDALVILSMPVRIRSQLKQWALFGLSFLPDSLLNRLGIVPKAKRDHVAFASARVAYDAHSIGSLARLEHIRREAFRRAENVRCPVLALQDPNDHHLRSEGMEILGRKLHHTSFTAEWVPGGEHELSMGPEQAAVFQHIDEFIGRALRTQTDRH
ncbi:MAG: alpha/beta fold hydrolase [Bdellovibrionota bacterium]